MILADFLQHMWFYALTEQNPGDILQKEILVNNSGMKGERKKLKLSTKGRYGLRALIDLAQYSSGGPVSTASISARQDISERYLEQLMSMIKKAGLVKSIRWAG